jgi:hypothetical protein
VPRLAVSPELLAPSATQRRGQPQRSRSKWRSSSSATRFIQVNGVNLSDHCSEITVESTADKVDLTAFGAAGYRDYGQGFKDATITAKFYQDYAAASVHATLQPLYDNGGTFAVYVKSDAAVTTSSTAPRIELFTAKMYGYNPLAGAVGDGSTMDVEFSNAGTAGLTYGTTGSP